MYTTVAARFYRAGRSRVPERWVVPGGGMHLVDVPDLCVLLEHPTEGLGLFDTGSSEIFAGNTWRLSLAAYRRVTQLRMTAADTARAQLQRDGVQPSEIRWIILSHLDPDHSGGLRDFPNARIICSRAVRDLASAHSVGAALRGRLFPRHLPLDFAQRARARKLRLDELTGGVFTISNGGIYGSLLSTPILNMPQSGILGMHKIEKRPVVLDDDKVVVRPMMYVALSYDHRIVDGREAVTFLRHIKELVEDPERIMMEI